MRCLNCSSTELEPVLDLVSSPPSNAYLSNDDLFLPERWHRLCMAVCRKCWLAQLDHVVSSDDIFDDDYAYFSSFSSSWVNHARQYVQHVIEKLNLAPGNTAVEIACNDGYLLQFFKNTGINYYGVEPTKGTANAAQKLGIDVVIDFFNTNLAKKLLSTKNSADLIIANNVLAHVPLINDFLGGFKVLLKAEGTITFEFPYLCNLVKYAQFDTIYHEHYFYFSLTALEPILSKHGLFIYDLEQLETHGGSLRVYVCHDDSSLARKSIAAQNLILNEAKLNLRSSDYYYPLKNKAERIKIDLISFLIEAKNSNKKVLGYGAAAKGNTLLNYCGIKSDLLSWVVDISSAKQGTYLPGSRIKIEHPEIIQEVMPDYILILPWNLTQEISTQLSYVREWGGKFVTAIPSLKVF